MLYCLYQQIFYSTLFCNPEHLWNGKKDGRFLLVR